MRRTPVCEWRTGLQDSSLELSRGGENAAAFRLDKRDRRSASALHGFGHAPHLQHHWPRGLSPGILLNRVTQSIHVGDPFGAGEKNLAFIVFFRNEHAVKTDVVHDHAE